MRRGGRRERLWLALVVMLTLGARTCAAAVLLPGVTQRAPESETAEPRAPGRRASRRALPDSVLAVIGSSRTITLSDFARAWNEDPARRAHDSPTPESARRFLDLLIDREMLIQEALARSRSWTAEESAQYRALRDRLMLGAALDSSLAASRAALVASGRTDLDPELVGIAARESAATHLGIVIDGAIIERVARGWAALPRLTADSSLAAQVKALSVGPAVDPGDLDRVVARSSIGDYRVRDLIEAWRRLSPIQRPRIETVDQLGDLVRNGLFERALRRAAETRGFDARPEIADGLARERERIAVSRLVGDEVFSRLERDSLGILGYFRAHRQDFTAPTRVRAIRLTLSSRTAAEKIAARLRDEADAESLEAGARHRGLDYRVEASAASDSALFAAAARAGTGAVVGPEPSGNDWWVARVEAFLPPRTRSLDEVRGEVERRWLAEEGDRRTRALCERLRRRTRVAINPVALRRLPGESATARTPPPLQR